MILVEVDRDIIRQLKAKLVAKDEKITELHAWADSMLRKIEVHEEQLAVLAARHEKALVEGAEMRTALTRIVNECSRFPIKDGLAFRVESIALNALETK